MTHREQPSAAGFPAASMMDNIVVNLCHVLPYYLRGIFTRNRLLFQLLAACRIQPFSVRFCRRLRNKYNSDIITINMLGRPTLMVLDISAVGHILDHSPAIHGEANLKRTGMTHFQPNAVTISHGEAWSDRRRFNEFVLDNEHSVHTDGDTFYDAIRRLVAAQSINGWDHWAHLFKQITLTIVFGDAKEEAIIRDLTAMMRESNRVFGLKKSGRYEAFNRAIRRHLSAPHPNSLVGRCPHAPTTSLTRPDNQVPHWLFAMNETLASNSYAALALIVTHPEAEARVRAELASVELTRAAGLNELPYLEGCVQEAMRLWPSIQLLVRQTLRRDTINGVMIPAHSQLMIPNTYHHRNTDAMADADRFKPERWLGGVTYGGYNHLSNGGQVCAGRSLALFIAKAVLVTMLSHNRYRLVAPRINADKPLPYQFDHYRARFKRASGTD